MKEDKITELIIGAAYEVSNTLGSGFLEKVYENALAEELLLRNIVFEKQKQIKVIYKNKIVGDYIADFIVESKVIVELKALANIDNSHIAQCLNYLKATGLNICLLINFGTAKVQLKRIINSSQMNADKRR